MKTKTEEERINYDRYIKDVRISRSTLETAFGDGRFDGRAEGRAEGKKAMILNMHRLKWPLEEIAVVAELSIEEVENIVCLAK
ncbi:MAG: hypothetical protein FJ390_06950 [Verrucomicrobia bacterium]|nr:hypothetical protein [Verrucomicrobiota bacterium]